MRQQISKLGQCSRLFPFPNPNYFCLKGWYLFCLWLRFPSSLTLFCCGQHASWEFPFLLFLGGEATKFCYMLSSRKTKPCLLGKLYTNIIISWGLLGTQCGGWVSRFWWKLPLLCFRSSLGTECKEMSKRWSFWCLQGQNNTHISKINYDISQCYQESKI